MVQIVVTLTPQRYFRMLQEAVLETALSLMRDAPLKTCLSGIQELPVGAPVLETDELVPLSDTLQLSKTTYAAKEAYHRAIATKSLQCIHKFSPILQNEINEDREGVYLKMKLLSEYILAHIESDQQLLSLQELTSLRHSVNTLKETQQEIIQQLTSSTEIVQTTLQKPLDSHRLEGLDIIDTISSSNKSLMFKLNELNTELSEKLNKLEQQYLLALSFSYVEDLEVHVSSTSKSNDSAYDMLMAHIASSAAQRGIPLPAPSDDTQRTTKVEWAKACIDSIYTAKVNSDSRESNTEKDLSSAVNKDVESLERALKDLQFAHQYLTKQYEDERSMNNNIINNHNSKKIALERQLTENTIALEKVTQRSILVEHEKSVLETKLDEKISNVMELQKQLALLKIDTIGSETPSLRPSYIASPVISPDKENLLLSPEQNSLGFTEEANPVTHNNRTPLLHQSINAFNSYRSGSPGSPRFNSSISILRKEFKSLVNDLHSDYHTELEKERAENKRLESLLKRYEQRDNDIEL